MTPRIRRQLSLLILASFTLIGTPLMAQFIPEIPQAPPNVLIPQNTGVHGSGASGSVTALDVSHLQPRHTENGWALDIPGMHPLATPAVNDGLVFIGGGFGSYEFYAIDAVTGAPRWGIRVSDDGPTGAVVAGGYVAFNTESCTLFIVRAEDGSQVWSRWLGDPLMSQPAIANGLVYMVYPAIQNHILAAFDLETGEERWQAALDTDAITAPVVANGDVYVTSHGGLVYRYDAASGQARWAEPQRATSAPWIDGDRVFVSMHDETSDNPTTPVEGLGYLARDSGNRAQAAGDSWGRREAVWLSSQVQAGSGYRAAQAENDSAVGFGDGAPAMARLQVAEGNTGQGTVHGMWEYQGSRPTLVGDRLLATVGDHLQATDVNTGETLWQTALPGDLSALGGHLATPPAIAGGWAYVGTTTGELIAFDPATGAEVWRHPVSHAVRSQPAIVGGRVYLGTTAGRLIMVNSGNPGSGDWPMWGGSAGHQLASAAH